MLHYQILSVTHPKEAKTDNQLRNRLADQKMEKYRITEKQNESLKALISFKYNPENYRIEKVLIY